MRKCCLLQTGVALCLALLLPASPPASAQPEECSPETVAPYVFFLLDTSSSMGWSPLCTQDMIFYGDCSLLCPTGNCYVPLQADDPASKFHHIKQGLYELLDEAWDIQFGFATFNQDQLRAKAKHWLYEAAGPGVSIPNWGPFPAPGEREVFGFNWGCDTGVNDHEIGCIVSKPADLHDEWENTRVRRVPKGGENFNQTVTLYIRNAGITYRVRHTPRPGFQLGGPIESEIRVDQCRNTLCSITTLVGTSIVAWTPVSDFLSWDNASSSSSPYRTNPQQSYFSTAANDVFSSNTCSGWDANTDSASDAYLGYNLRWPTVSDLRGTFFDSGDVLPWDWQTSHSGDIQLRLAPNALIAPTAPDFRIASYLSDHPLPGETYLRLKNEDLRPLIASGSTPLGNSLSAFGNWYTGWKATAELQDPLWACRKKAVVLITDGDETCTGDPCSVASDLLLSQGVYTFVVAFGADELVPSQLTCIAENGGTSVVSYPQSGKELKNVMQYIFLARLPQLP